MSNIANTANRLAVKKVLINSKANSNLAEMGTTYDIALCDGSAATQKVYLPVTADSHNQEVVVSVSDVSVGNTEVYDSTGGSKLFTLTAVGKYTFYNNAGTWIKE